MGVFSVPSYFFFQAVAILGAPLSFYEIPWNWSFQDIVLPRKFPGCFSKHKEVRKEHIVDSVLSASYCYLCFHTFVFFLQVQMDHWPKFLVLFISLETFRINPNTDIVKRGCLWGPAGVTETKLRLISSLGPLSTVFRAQIFPPGEYRGERCLWQVKFDFIELWRGWKVSKELREAGSEPFSQLYPASMPLLLLIIQ